jgi:hypothetical protein
MDDRALTGELAAIAGVPVAGAELDALFGFAPELTEWSVNAAEDRRGTLRASVWTKDRRAAEAVVERFAPAQRAAREALVGHDFEGVGLALRGDGRSSFRWWSLADDGAALAERARRVWPQHAAEIEAVLAAAGGTYACAGVGLEVAGTALRHTVYAELRQPSAALHVLELAGVVVSQPANLFWKGIVGLEPGGRPWPRVWVGRSFGPAGGWKFYYFSRGDELRRSDEVLLDAVSASPEARGVWARLRTVSPGPCIQLIGLTFPDAGGAPSFTTYLARF